MDLDLDLDWGPAWHGTVYRWLGRGLDKHYCVAMLSQCQDYEVLREAYSGLLKVPHENITFSKLQGIMVKTEKLVQNPAFAPGQPLLVPHQYEIRVQALTGASDSWPLSRDDYLSKLRAALLEAQNERRTREDAMAQPLQVPVFDPLTEDEFKDVATNVMMLTTNEAQVQLNALIAEYDQKYTHLVAQAEKVKKRADKPMEHADFEERHSEAEKLFKFPLGKDVYCANFAQMAVLRKDARLGRLSADPKVHPDRLTPMATANGVYLKDAKEEGDAKEESLVSKSRSGPALLAGIRLYLFGAMQMKNDKRWLTPLPILAFLDVMQLVLAHPNITLDEAYQERDVCLEEVRGLSREWDAGGGTSPAEALLTVCKAVHVRLKTTYTLHHQRLASGGKTAGGEVSKDVVKLQRENEELKRENSRLTKELASEKNRVQQLKKRDDSRGRDEYSRDRDESRGRADYSRRREDSERRSRRQRVGFQRDDRSQSRERPRNGILRRD